MDSFFPAVEHARTAIETGVIGEVVLTQSDFIDPIYTIQAAPLAFGASAVPIGVVATGRHAGGAIVDYGDNKYAVLTFPPRNSEFSEVTELVGTEGRITLERPGHCPTRISIRIPPPNGVPSQYRTRNAPAPLHAYDYPLPGSVAMARSSPNQHGFLYQAEAVHRCLGCWLTSMSTIRQGRVVACDERADGNQQGKASLTGLIKFCRRSF